MGTLLIRKYIENLVGCVISRLWSIWSGGELEDGGGTGGQAVISISGPGRSCKVGPEGVFRVSPLLSISGLSGIFLITRPAHDARLPFPVAGVRIPS